MPPDLCRILQQLRDKPLIAVDWYILKSTIARQPLDQARVELIVLDDPQVKMVFQKLVAVLGWQIAEEDVVVENLSSLLHAVVAHVDHHLAIHQSGIANLLGSIPGLVEHLFASGQDQTLILGRADHLDEFEGRAILTLLVARASVAKESGAHEIVEIEDLGLSSPKHRLPLGEILADDDRLEAIGEMLVEQHIGERRLSNAGKSDRITTWSDLSATSARG